MVVLTVKVVIFDGDKKGFNQQQMMA